MPGGYRRNLEPSGFYILWTKRHIHERRMVLCPSYDDLQRIFSDLKVLWETVSNVLDRLRVYMESQDIINSEVEKIANQILI